MEDNIVASVLYVDDEANNLTSFKAAMRRHYQVFTALSAEEGMRILDTEHINIIITDQRMPDTTGVQFLVKVLEKHPEPIRILLTGYADLAAVVDAVNLGHIYFYVTKPWEEQHLKNLLDKSFEVYQLREENRVLTKELLRVNEQLEFMLRQQLLS